MTTKVTIEARTLDNKQVIITTTSEHGTDHTIIQNGETHECYTYDDRLITIKESIKEAEANKETDKATTDSTKRVDVAGYA